MLRKKPSDFVNKDFIFKKKNNIKKNRLNRTKSL